MEDEGRAADGWGATGLKRHEKALEAWQNIQLTNAQHIFASFRWLARCAFHHYVARISVHTSGFLFTSFPRKSCLILKYLFA
jgi:hypothetical protein